MYSKLMTALVVVFLVSSLVLYGDYSQEVSNYNTASSELSSLQSSNANLTDANSYLHTERGSNKSQTS